MAFSEIYCDAAAGSNLNAGFPIGGAYPVTSTNGAYTQGGGAGGTDRFTAAAGTPFSGCAAGDLVSSYTDGASAPTGFIGRITAVNGGGASIDISLTIIAGTRPTTGASGRTAKVGGALLGPNAASGFPIGFITAALAASSTTPVRVNFKNGTDYAVSATSGSTIATASLTGPITWEGYTSAPGDGGIAIFNGTGGSAGVVFKQLVISGTAQTWKYLHWKGNYAGSPTGGDANGNNMVDSQATNQLFFNCIFSGAWRMGLQVNGTGNASGATVDTCTAYDCNNDDASDFAGIGASEECLLVNCLSTGNGAGGTDSLGFYLNGSAGEPITMLNCISTLNSNAGIKVAGATPVKIRNCTIWGNASHGIFTTATSVAAMDVVNCIIGDNGTAGSVYGISSNASFDGASMMIRNNAFFDNFTGQTNNINASFISGSVTLSGDPFTDSANGDFSLNNTAGAGADCRNAGAGAWIFTGSGYSESTDTFPSIGAAEPDAAAPAGGQTSYTFG